MSTDTREARLARRISDLYATDQQFADAAEMPRRFNAPGGIAHTSADSIAERTTAAATTSRRGCDAFH